MHRIRLFAGSAALALVAAIPAHAAAVRIASPLR